MNPPNQRPAADNEQNVERAKAALARWSACTMTGEDYDANLAKIQKQFRFYNSNIYVLNKVPPHSVYGIHTPVFSATARA